MLDRLVEIRLAPRLEPNVDRAELIERRVEIVGLVADRDAGPELAADLHFLFRTGRRQNAGADGAGHLDHARSDSARAAVDEHALAGLQLGLAEQPQVRGDADQCRGGRVFVGNLLGRRIKPALIDRHVLRERALTAQQSLVAPPDPVALAIFGHFGTDRLDRAGQIATDDKRRWQVDGDQTCADVSIDGIDRDRADPDQDLAGLGFWFREVAIDDVLGWANSFNVCGFQNAWLLGPSNHNRWYSFI